VAQVDRGDRGACAASKDAVAVPEQAKNRAIVDEPLAAIFGKRATRQRQLKWFWARLKQLR
jgi:hypothetical protein